MNDAARPPGQAGAAPHVPVFVTGPTMRHVAVMTATASVGLVAIFAVDFFSLLYISWLNNNVLTAGVGIGSTVLFITMSVNIGFMIAVGALVSRALGARRREEARRLAGSAVTLMGLVGLAVGLLMLPLLKPLLFLLGARGEVLDVAWRYLAIIMPSNVFVSIGMGLASVLRAVGDARRAMWVTLASGIVTAIFDPFLIFVAKLGTDGAALAIVAARMSFVVIGFYGAVRVHDLVARPTLATLREDAPRVLGVAVPAALTNLASPIAIAFVAAIMIRFGEDVMAANAIIDRVVPLAYGVIFALTGAVGPILGQNWGARRFDRVRQALKDALLFTALYVGAIWIVLVLLRNVIPAMFGVTGDIAGLVAFFCVMSGPIWLFMGALFVANASFNNLGFPFYATAFNWGRATLGTIPFTLLGAWFAGPKGVQLGFFVGAFVFGIAAVVFGFRVIARLEAREAPLPARPGGP